MAGPSFPEFHKIVEFVVTEIEPEDRGILSPMEDGSQKSRAQFTKSRLNFSVSAKMQASDLLIFLEYYRNDIKGSSLIFSWTNPDSNSPYYGQTYNVRMTSLSKPQKLFLDYWGFNFTLTEA
jgi:hypothetical protein